MPPLQRTLIPVLILLAAGAPATAQSRKGVSFSAGAHALTVPWYPGPVAERFNPALLVGMDRTLRSSEHWRFSWGVNVGFFRHHWWMTGVSVEPELGIARSVPGGLQTDLRLGLGYLHYFWRRETLELKDGRYVKATDGGKPSLLLPLTLTLRYQGGDSEAPHRVQPFLSARWAVQGLFLPEAPAMTHFFLLGGVRVETGGESPEGGR